MIIVSIQYQFLSESGIFGPNIKPFQYFFHYKFPKVSKECMTLISGKFIIYEKFSNLYGLDPKMVIFIFFFKQNFFSEVNIEKPGILKTLVTFCFWGNSVIKVGLAPCFIYFNESPLKIITLFISS